MNNNPDTPNPAEGGALQEMADRDDRTQELAHTIVRGRGGARAVLTLMAVLSGAGVALEAKAEEPSTPASQCQVYQAPGMIKPWTLIEGNCENGLAEGYGRANVRGTWLLYEGYYHKGKRQGRGSASNVDREWRYDGEWKDDLYHGHGEESGPKDVYNGEWKEGKRHGQGTYARYKIPDGNIVEYTGEWQDGVLQGQATKTLANGEKYVGQWFNSKQHGQGVYTWPDGTKFVGTWKDDVRDGQGTLTFPNGEKYVGQWSNDKRNGKGTYTWPDGMIFTGEWKDDNRIEATGTWSFPRKYKTPNALYVYAGQLEANGNMTGALVIYNHIIKKFPTSSIAVRATDRLRQIRESAAATKAAEEQRRATAQTAAEERQAAEARRRSDRIDGCYSQYNSSLVSCSGLPDKTVTGTGLFGAPEHDYPRDRCLKMAKRALENCLP